MNRNNEKKNEQLGMPHGTANAILRKNILFELLKRHGENICFQCGEEIKTIDELSIEHKVPWLDSENPTELFFSISNIAFSHLKCNVGAGRKPSPSKTVHGTLLSYNKRKCRCAECTNANTIYRRNRDIITGRTNHNKKKIDNGRLTEW